VNFDAAAEQTRKKEKILRKICFIPKIMAWLISIKHVQLLVLNKSGANVSAVVS
jgi:hypothetical protein